MDELRVEATGEAVGEAKWAALRELESLEPALDKAAVRFEIVSEGERGLLGVGYSPARVVATADAATEPGLPRQESELAADLRELLELIAAGIGVHCRVDVEEDEESVTAVCTGRELGVLIGRHGQTIDAIQYLATAILARDQGDVRKSVPADEARRVLLDASLRGLELARRYGGPIVDVGSGGGAPGIPLALALPERAVTLLEANGRKCEFLRL